jgi:hypothetical protein
MWNKQTVACLNVLSHHLQGLTEGNHGKDAIRISNLWPNIWTRHISNTEQGVSSESRSSILDLVLSELPTKRSFIHALRKFHRNHSKYREQHKKREFAKHSHVIIFQINGFTFFLACVYECIYEIILRNALKCTEDIDSTCEKNGTIILQSRLDCMPIDIHLTLQNCVNANGPKDR